MGALAPPQLPLIIVQNKTCASKVFASMVDCDMVLASHKLHWWIPCCAYAIVSLEEGVSHFLSIHG
jgi:hypothetical protein